MIALIVTSPPMLVPYRNAHQILAGFEIVERVIDFVETVAFGNQAGHVDAFVAHHVQNLDDIRRGAQRHAGDLDFLHGKAAVADRKRRFTEPADDRRVPPGRVAWMI